MYLRRSAVVLAVLALAVAGCGARDGGGPAEDDKKSEGSTGARMSWSYDEILDGSAKLNDMAVVAEDDIWAFGRRRGTDYADHPFLLHHDGKEWREQTLPESVREGQETGLGIRLDTLGSDEVWMTALVGGGGPEQRQWILRWTGTEWSPLKAQPTELIGVYKIFGPDDVWALVGSGGVQHWDGTRWTAMNVPIDGVAALDGVASDDLWAVGSRRTGEIDDLGESSQPDAAHWDGRTWKRTEVPEYHFPEPVPPEAGASLGRVVALAEDDVLAYGMNSFNHGEVEPEPDEQAIRLRWDGTRWVEQPAAPGQCAERVPVLSDGANGLFLNGNWYLTADGECVKITRSRLPNEGGVRKGSQQMLWVEDLARVPGTGEVLGAGHVDVNQSGNPMSKAVVVSLRR